MSLFNFSAVAAGGRKTRLRGGTTRIKKDDGLKAGALTRIFYIRPSIDTNGILNLIHGEDEDNDDRFIDSLIVDTTEKFIKECIDNGECVSIPRIGRVRHNLIEREFRTKLKAVKAIINTGNKELINEYIRSTREETIHSVNARLDKQNRFNKAIKTNQELYNTLYRTVGKPYARLKIFSMLRMSFIPFNQEDEDHLQKLFEQND